MSIVKLTNDQLEQKLKFKDEYFAAGNAASGSKLDANANVEQKNIATFAAELNKSENLQFNRYDLYKRISELFGKEQADKYIEQLENHTIYTHDETSPLPYCVSISMYPFLLNGTKCFGGPSCGPKHLASFCGNFVNLVFGISAQFAGAVATVEFLMYFDHFARRDYGEDYLDKYLSGDKRMIFDINNWLQHVVYALNQPAAARGFQSVFWNISLYDKEYFESMFGTFVFPNGMKPEYNNVKRIQDIFMKWFNAEREKAILTFPVVTAAMLTDGEKPRDEEFAKARAKDLAEGNSFFIYQSPDASSLSSCCRLRSEMTDNTFSYSLGAGGVSTGSINVITINMNRLEQQKKYTLSEIVQDIHKYQVAYRTIMDDYKAKKALPAYDAGFISLDKQFLTIGINGMLEAAEYNGITAGNNQEYKDFISEKLKIIFDLNKEAKQKYKDYKVMFNTEFVPAENLGVKNAKWDKADGLFVPRDCYNSYFYIVEDEDTNFIDKFVLHGKEINQFLDGGSALHLNLEEYLTEDQFYKLFEISAKTGCNYFCTNVKVTICNNEKCGHIDKNTRNSCSKCGSTDIDYGTRIIGYLKRITSFSDSRKSEALKRVYHAEEKCNVK